MKVNLTDCYGQTITLLNVSGFFPSNIEDNVLCVKIKGEKTARRYNLRALNYWECIENENCKLEL